MDTTSFGNPTFSVDTFRARSRSHAMTRSGVAAWLGGLILILLLSGGFTWSLAFKAFGNINFASIQQVEVEKDASGNAVNAFRIVDPKTGEITIPPKVDFSMVNFWMWIGIIGGILSGMVCIVENNSAIITAPLYAACEGLALGGLSALLEMQFGGIVMQSVALSLFIMVAMYLLFVTGIIRLTGGLAAGILACLLGVLALYMLDLVLSSYGHQIGFLHSNGPWGIAFSIFVCILAAFCFLVDFETIEQGLSRNADKRYEPYCAFSVLVTLVWLYLEILRLLVKLKGEDNN